MSTHDGVRESVVDQIAAEDLGLTLRFRRQAAGLTQRAIAQAIGVERSALANFEIGRGKLDSVKLFAAFQLCGCVVLVAQPARLRPVVARTLHTVS